METDNKSARINALYLSQSAVNSALHDDPTAEQLLNGTYYARVFQVWDVERLDDNGDNPLDRDCVNRMCRTGSGDASGSKTAGPASPYALPCRGDLRNAESVDAYSATLDPVFRQKQAQVQQSTAESPRQIYFVADPPQRFDEDEEDEDDRYSPSAMKEKAAEDEIWPLNMFGIGMVFHVDMASLIPKLDMERETDALKGFQYTDKPDDGSDAKNDAAALEETPVATGILHLKTNRMRIPGRAAFLDEFPSILIVPILTVEEARAWNGRAYDAIVMVECIHSQRIDDVQSLTSRANMTIRNQFGLASNDEIDTAGALLHHMMRAIRHFITHSPPDVPQNVYTNAGSDVHVPTNIDRPTVVFHVPQSRKSDNLHVRKIEFSAANDWNAASWTKAANLAVTSASTWHRIRCSWSPGLPWSFPLYTAIALPQEPSLRKCIGWIRMPKNSSWRGAILFIAHQRTATNWHERWVSCSAARRLAHLSVESRRVPRDWHQEKTPSHKVIYFINRMCIVYLHHNRN